MTTSAAPRDQSGPCSECRNSATLPRFLVLVAVFATLGAFCSSLAQERVSTPDDAPLRLPPVTVNAAEDPEFDATGMGSLDEQLRDEPFANDLIKPIDTQLDESMTADLGGELAAVAQPSPADRISGEERLNLRGFPTPVMRNGFVQLGISDYLNTARTVVIQGPLVPVLGRAAPGGIQDMQTARPQAKERQRFDVQFTSLDRQRVQLPVPS
jgi:iron complex outermembrane receptor protein